MKLSAKQIVFALLTLIMVLTATGCATSYNTVFVTPPDYGIVINLNDPSSQATSGNLDSGVLMNVTQQTVKSTRCVESLANKDECPDVMVVQVPGAFVTRLYTGDNNSGTSGNNQSLCFEANGANGCVDFTVTAKVEREKAICYANKVGIKAVDGSRFYFKAVALEDTMDNRVIGITSGIFSEAVAKVSPLSLALEKYIIFNNIKQTVIDKIFEQTCITIKPNEIYISNGITWKDQAIQEQINQATVIANQLELLKQKNELQKQQIEALLTRAQIIEKEYGLEAAIRFLEIQTEQMKIDKWSGDSWIPFLSPPTPDFVPTDVPATPAP